MGPALTGQANRFQEPPELRRDSGKALRLGERELRTASRRHPKDFLSFDYKIMNYQEGPFDQLPMSGLSAGRVARETRRAIASAGGRVEICPGIDIDVPARATGDRTAPDDVRRSLRAAMDPDADGVVVSREYVEAWLANLTAAGDGLREIFAGRAG
jgi:hypothetical protein